MEKSLRSPSLTGTSQTLVSLTLSPSTSHFTTKPLFIYFQYHFSCFGAEYTAQLLELPEQYNKSLDNFLGGQNRADLSWLHDVRLHKFADASKHLKSAVVMETASLSSKKTLVSLSKLAAFASGEGILPSYPSSSAPLR